MITFNGYYLKDFCIIKDIGRQIMPSVSVSMIDIQGRDGSYYFRKKKEARVINVEIMMLGNTKEEIRQTAQQLANILDTEDPAPLFFDDQPGVEYRAIVSGDTDISEETFFGVSTIQFVCPDPYGVGTATTETAVTSTGTVLVNPGNAKTFPKYEIKFNTSATFFSLIHPDGATLIGDPEAIDKITIPEKELAFFDDANDLTAWTVNTGITVENGIATGAVQSVASRIQPTDYGTNANGWHGPALKHALPEQLQDFQVDLQMSMSASDAKQVGQLECYLLDQNDTVIGVMRARDSSANYDATHLQWRAGGLSDPYSMLVLRGFDYEYYADTSLLLRVERKGTKWTLYSHKFGPDGEAIRPYTKEFTFNEGQYNDKQLASIVLYFGGYKTFIPINSVNLERITVWKLNAITEVNVPEIFLAGDVLEIDTYSGKVLKNGEPFFGALDPGSRFLPIGPGETEIAWYTNDPANVTVTAYHNERWK
jgi:predicted phage tail component-like protein